MINEDEGFHRIETKYDRAGREILNIHYGVDGKILQEPVKIGSWLSQYLMPQIRYDYDKNGNMERTTTLDAEGNPAVPPEESCAINFSVFNGRGQEVEERCEGPEGQLVLNDRDWAKKTSRYADDGWWALEEAYFDAQDKPVLVNGYARMTRKLDEWNNLLEEAYFGVNEEPVAPNGYARQEQKYERGNRIERAWYDVSDALVAVGWNSVAKETSKYDERGKEIEKSTHGADEKPVLVDGVATTRSGYDDSGNQNYEGYFGLTDEPVADEYGCFSWRSRHNIRRENTENACHGEDGRLTKNNKGWAKEVFTFDGGHRTSEEWQNEEGFAIAPEGDHSRIEYVYKNGRQVEEKYLAPNGGPVLNDAGWARKTWEYNEQNRLIKETHFGRGENLVLNSGGWAEVAYTYDHMNREIEKVYKDVRGHPVDLKGGYARVTTTFEGKEETEVYTNAAGEVVEQ